MTILVGIGLLLLGVFLWYLSKTEVIGGPALDAVEKIASIVAVVAALIVLMFPGINNSISTDERDEQIATTTVLANTPRPNPTETSTVEIAATVIRAPTTAPSPVPSPSTPPTITPTLPELLSTNNPSKWMSDPRDNDQSFRLIESGNRNLSEASQRFQPVDRSNYVDRLRIWGLDSVAYQYFQVDCDTLQALVALDQEIYAFSSEQGAIEAFNFWKLKPDDFTLTGDYVIQTDDIRQNGELGEESVLVSHAIDYFHCGETISVYDAISVFRRANVVGIVVTIGRDESNTRIANMFHAINTDVNIYVDQ